jgi:hypothetical protein
MAIRSNYFAPTEAQRRVLDRLWKTHERLTTRPAKRRDDEWAVKRSRRIIEDTIAANMNGFANAEEARRP